MIKIVVLGDCGSGKTSLIRKFIHGTFDPESRPTIGANFFEKSFYLQNSEINLQFWDTTGQEHLRSSFDIYLKGAAGAIIVGDYRLANAREFKGLKDWRELLL
jgi:small GTP-binding protein